MQGCSILPALVGCVGGCTPLCKFVHFHSPLASHHSRAVGFFCALLRSPAIL